MWPDKYGADHVAQIITFGTMAARGVLRDVGRVMGMSYPEVDAHRQDGALCPGYDAGTRARAESANCTPPMKPRSACAN